MRSRLDERFGRHLHVLSRGLPTHCLTCLGHEPLLFLFDARLGHFPDPFLDFPLSSFVIVLRPQCVSKDTSMSPSFMLPASCLTLECGHLRPIFVLTVFRDAGDAVTH